MTTKCRLFLAFAGTVMAAAVLLRPRSEPAALASGPATPPAEHLESEMAVPRAVAGAGRLEAPRGNTGFTNLLERTLRGEGIKLTPAQISAFLAANHRSAESLLAASRVSGDPAYLKEAKERFPDDVRVQFAAIFKSDSPEERSQWLDRLRQSAPDNALPDYLSAFDDLKAGRTEQGVQELSAAAGKTGFQDYALDSIQSAEEAYRSAGCSEAEAKMVATQETPLPQLAQLKQLSLSIVDLANSYRQAGDTASGQTVLDMAIHLGQQLDANGPGGQFLINNLVGIAIQLNALKAMDPASPYGSSGQTVQDSIDQLMEQRAASKQLRQQTETLWQTMPPQDMISFFDRQKLYGEQATLQWYLDKNGQLTGPGQD
jgi:hypothetical protein